jgi:hypothetical protein
MLKSWKEVLSVPESLVQELKISRLQDAIVQEDKFSSSVPAQGEFPIQDD